MRRTAADTNLLVRLLVVDDPEQSARAALLLSDGLLIVETTVVLEIEWVLRSAFRLARATVNGLLTDLVAMRRVRLTEEDRVLTAVMLHRRGLDFADALHLLGAGDSDEFVTFDRELAKRAERLQVGIPIRLL